MSVAFREFKRPQPESSLQRELSQLLSKPESEPVILLRSLPAEFCPTRDDVDLLLTPTRRDELLRDFLQASTAGRLVFSVQQTSPDKMRLRLWSLDLTDWLDVDLWVVFNQVPSERRGGRLCLPAADLLQWPLTAATELPGAWRLPPDLDFCLLVLHLASKRKSLRCAVTRERILEAVERLKSAPVDNELPEMASRLASALQVLPDQVRQAADWLSERLAEGPVGGQFAATGKGRRRRKLPDRSRRSMWQRIRLALRSRVPVLAITGSDGVGKSAVVSELNRMQPRSIQPLVAKKLYRRSLLYQLTAGILQQLAGWSREAVDDRLAPLLALRSAAALWTRVLLRLVFGSPVAVLTGAGVATLVLDRSPNAVLITDRKSLQPKLWRMRWLERLQPPLTSVLLVLPFERLVARRAEMCSAASHQTYQQLLLDQALRQQPVELFVLHAGDSAHQLARKVLRLTARQPSASAANRNEKPGRTDGRTSASDSGAPLKQPPRRIGEAA